MGERKVPQLTAYIPSQNMFPENIGHANNYKENSHLPKIHTQTKMPQQMKLVLSTDAKPRLKWTPHLHQRFVDAVKQLGGPHKATPKSLMRIMSIHGLTLFHLKSHLQKYRLGRSQLSHKQETSNNEENQATKCNAEEEKINDVQVAKALEMQMDVQRKLQQQIEVQRHLQLRIEAQGKYLQTVLKKAQETLCGYRACSIEVEHARAQLSQLASMVDSSCKSSSLSELESSLTSSDSSENNKRRCVAEEMNPVLKRRKKKKDIDLNVLDMGIDLNCNGLQLFGSTF